MTEEGADILSLADRFRVSHGQSWRAHPSDEADMRCSCEKEPAKAMELVLLSHQLSFLVQQTTPSNANLMTAAELFDEVSRQQWSDPFGERYEILAILCYVAWRNAFFLGLEEESQQWLRNVFLVASEDFAAKECIRSALFLDEGLRSERIFAGLLSSPPDVFLALAVLHTELQRAHLKVLGASEYLFGWLSKSLPDASSGEQEFFRSEVAYIASSVSRALGLRRKRRRWIIETQRIVLRLPSNRPLRARLLGLRLIDSYDNHRTSTLSRRSAVILHELGRFGLYHEAIRCRTATAFTKKALGDVAAARCEISQISEECRFSSEQGLFAVCLNDLADLKAQEGDFLEATRLSAEALEAAQRSEDPTIVGSVLTTLGTIHLAAGHAPLAVLAFQRGLRSYAKSGSRTWVAYTRIWLAEGLIQLARFDEAREHLRQALAIADQDTMVHEGIHALRLLCDLESADKRSVTRHRHRPWRPES